jgi:hypothetical protein
MSMDRFVPAPEMWHVRRGRRGAQVETATEINGRALHLRRLAPELLFIALAVGLPFGLGTAQSIFRDGDVSWQVAAGKWILQHGQIPTTDPFSYTVFGHRWVAMEWLAQIIYGSAFSLDGYAGLATVVAAAVIALFAILYFHLESRASPIAVTVALLMVAFVLAPFILARPHVLAWPLFAGWTILLLHAAERGAPPPLWTTLLLVVWTNLHASFPLALVIEAAIGFDALVSAKWSTIRPWLFFGATSVVALMLNLNGLAGLRQPFETSSLSMLPFIAEWHASTTNSTPYFYGALAIGIGMLLYSGVRVPFGRLVLLIAMMGLAFLHVRHQSFFIIIAACTLPPLAGTVPASYRVPRWLLAGALPLLAFRALVPLLPPEGPANPRRLLAAVPPDLRNRPVLNEYTFGGPLILAGIRPYIDGRGEIYGDAFVANYLKITDGDMHAFDEAVRRYDIRWTMLSPSQASLIHSIEASGEWRRVYADEIGVIDVRQTALNGHPRLPSQ